MPALAFSFRIAAWPKRLFVLILFLNSLPLLAATTTVAFVDFDKSAVGGALETRLLANRDYQWVERSTIEQLIKEQKTQALFARVGVADRSAFGRILKADILILLRTKPGQAD